MAIENSADRARDAGGIVGKIPKRLGANVDAVICSGPEFVERMASPPNLASGYVYLVGAGPGDPGLLTVRAVECLGQADVVLCDYLANPALLKHASANAELVTLGHHGGGRTLSPDEITARMLAEARKGRTVVRLKGGDSSVFGRGAEEMEALRDAGIPFEVVPGITTAFAAAAYCEIPITHHEGASAVALIAGRERDDKPGSGLDFGALAVFPGTLVFYMGVKTAAHWSRALIEHGKAAGTPVAIVRWCARPQQQMVRCTLQTVEQAIAEHGLRPPVIFVVGKVVDYAPQLSWFTARPLFGVRVLAVGTGETTRAISDRLAALGADVIPRPAVRIVDPADWTPVDAALERLDRYAWLVFSDGPGVDFFLKRLDDRGGDARRLGGVKLAAIGADAEACLRRYRLRADVVCEECEADSLVGALTRGAHGERFLMVSADQVGSLLAESLTAVGAGVDQIVVYSRADVQRPAPSVTEVLSAGQVDWIAVTDSVAARSLDRLHGDVLRHARLASIGPLTSAALRACGHEPTVEASPSTMDGLVDAMLRWGQKTLGESQSASDPAR